MKIDLNNISLEEADKTSLEGLDLFSNSSTKASMPKKISVVGETDIDNGTTNNTVAKDETHDVKSDGPIKMDETILKIDGKPKVIRNVIDNTDDAWVADVLHDVESAIVNGGDKNMAGLLERAVEVIIYLKDVKKAESFNREKSIKKESKKRENAYNIGIGIAIMVAVVFMAYTGGGMTGIDNSIKHQTTISIGNSLESNSIIGDNNGIENDTKKEL